MRFYNIDMQGIFLAPRASAVPSAVAANEGRLLYNTTDDSLYFQAAAAWRECWHTGNDSDLFNASNLATGTVPVNRLSGTYNIDISGTADAAKYS